MLDIMYELPDKTAGMKYVVNEEVVLGHEKLFPIAEAKHEAADAGPGWKNRRISAETPPVAAV